MNCDVRGRCRQLPSCIIATVVLAELLVVDCWRRCGRVLVAKAVVISRRTAQWYQTNVIHRARRVDRCATKRGEVRGKVRWAARGCCGEERLGDTSSPMFHLYQPQLPTSSPSPSRSSHRVMAADMSVEKHITASARNWPTTAASTMHVFVDRQSTPAGRASCLVAAGQSGRLLSPGAPCSR